MKLFIIFIAFILSPEVFAHESHEESKEVRILREMEVGRQGKAYVVAREQGHVLGQNYQLELRLNCSGEKKEVSDLPIHDSLSVCDVDPKSLKINTKKSAVAMKTKIADMDSYYEQIEKGDKLAQVKCGKKTKIMKFSLKKLCQ